MFSKLGVKNAAKKYGRALGMKAVNGGVTYATGSARLGKMAEAAAGAGLDYSGTAGVQVGIPTAGIRGYVPKGGPGGPVTNVRYLQAMARDQNAVMMPRRPSYHVAHYVDQNTTWGRSLNY